MTIKHKRSVYYGRYFRTGCSWAVVIPPECRDTLQLHPGDTLAIAMVRDVLIMRKATQEMIIPRAEMTAIMDRMFPAKDADASNG